jgi:fluoride exporter
VIALLGVALAGALGAPARLLVDQLVSTRRSGRFPWGTFVVNASGALVLGVITGLALYHGLGDLPDTVVGIGFLGAYTTFSTFSFETVRLIEEGEGRAALRNVAGSVGVGLLAAAAGLGLTAVL